MKNKNSRTKRISVCISEDDYQFLLDQRQAGESISSYIYNHTFNNNKDVIDYRYEERYKEAIERDEDFLRIIRETIFNFLASRDKELFAQGRNLNQIARSLNQNESDISSQQLLKEIETTKALLEFNKQTLFELSNYLVKKLGN